MSEVEVGCAFILKSRPLYLRRNLLHLASGSVLTEKISPDSSFWHSMITVPLKNLVSVMFYSIRQTVNQP